MGWALDQSIPSRAKLLLVALANHADHTSGYCWPSVDTLMRETSMSRRAVFGYLGALRRNGFIESRANHAKDGRQRSNDYWILFDREPAEWAHLKSEEEVEEDSSTEGTTDDSRGEVDTKNAPSPAIEAETIPAPLPSIPCTPIEEPSDSNRQSPELMEGRKIKSDRPKDFSSRERFQQQATLQAAEEARRPQRIPIIEGSKPWEAWIRAGHPRTLVGIVVVNGKNHRGWYFDASKCNGLYPKLTQSTGPPPTQPLMTAEDEEEILKTGLG